MRTKASGARRHGGPRRRVWRKIHLGIDEQILEVRAVGINWSHDGDGEQRSATVDGAFNARMCLDAIGDRGDHGVVLTRKNAKPWKTVTAVEILRTKARERRDILARQFGEPETDTTVEPC